MPVTVPTPPPVPPKTTASQYKCPFLLQCREVIKALQIPTEILSNDCMCARCTTPSNDALLPLGWAKFALELPDRFEKAKQQVFTTWVRCYSGTSFNNAKDVLQKTLPLQFLSSPSIKYISHDKFTPPTRVGNLNVKVCLYT